MNIEIIYLNYQAPDRQIYEPARKSVYNSVGFMLESGHNVIIRPISEFGISKAINKGLRYSVQERKDVDYVAICADDIVMPKMWLYHMVQCAEMFPNTGIVGIHTVETLPEKDENGMHATWCPFGNWLLSRKCIEAIGAFNEKQDPYGMQDSDYAYRASKAGFYNFYIPEMRAYHIGHDVGNGTEYRKMKDEGLSKAGKIYEECIKQYDLTKNYFIPWGRQNT